MQKPVLTIFYQFNPWNSSIGGIQTVVCYLLKYAPPDFTVRLVGIAEPSERIGVWQTKEYAGNSIEFLPVIGIEDDNVRHLIPTTLKYTAALWRHDLSSDFLYFHRLEYALAGSGWTGKKIFSLHNDIRKQMDSCSGNNGILWQKFPQLYFGLERALISKFDQIYVCHTDSLAFYQQRYAQIGDRFAYLENPVDLELFSPPQQKQRERQKLAKELELPEDTKFVLFVGRLHPQKDPLLLIQAMSAVKHNSAHLLMAGEGELRGAIEAEISRCGLGDRVTLLGAVPPQQMADLYRQADVFVLSSAYEGFPLSVLEALACGTPVVSTKAGEIPRVLTPNSGIVTQDRSLTTLAQALDQVLSQPEKFTADACISAVEPYSAKTVVAKVYQTMRTAWREQLDHKMLPHLPI